MDDTRYLAADQIEVSWPGLFNGHISGRMKEVLPTREVVHGTVSHAQCAGHRHIYINNSAIVQNM